jgi:2-(3-amino-3-carboxypropyl)histidine synthase
MAAIEVARNARTVGILVSSKPGQRGFEVAEELERRLEGVGVKAAIIYLDEVRAEHLNNFTEPQAFIVTACPRIALDGVAGVVRPMLTVLEAQVALGDVTWDEAWDRGLMA